MVTICSPLKLWNKSLPARSNVCALTHLTTPAAHSNTMDDGLEHSIWLSLMRDRLEIIRRFLSNDGSLWITIDDNEAHYLKVICDEIFGRENFVANAVWQKKYTVANDAKWLSENHDHVLIYAL